MRKYIIIFLLFTTTNALAQDKVTVASVKHLFQKSKDIFQNGRFVYPTDKTWLFENNKDSLYFKRDTLVGIFHKSGKRKNLCESISWTFHKKNEFVIHRESMCKEPPSISTLKFPDDYFSIAIYKVEHEIMIDVLSRNDKMIMESFKVVSLEIKKDFNKIVLQRRFNPYE